MKTLQETIERSKTHGEIADATWTGDTASLLASLREANHLSEPSAS